MGYAQEAMGKKLEKPGALCVGACGLAFALAGLLLLAMLGNLLATLVAG